MYSKQQHGKGMIAFLAGSVVALVAIALMLLALNKNNQNVFKQPETVKPKQPEILTPNNVSSAPPAVVHQTPPSDVVPNMPPLSASVPHVTQHEPAQSKSAALAVAIEHTEHTHETTLIGKTPESDVAVESNLANPPSDLPNGAPVVQGKPVENKAKPMKEKELAKKPHKEVKPTAQQILDSGNLEKAQQIARQEAQAKEEKIAKKVDKKSNKQPTISIQAGAYSNKQAAEEQRAKLALMGVQTQVVSVQSGGKNVYRVQTNKLSDEKAAQVEQTLKKNGINTYVHK